MRNFILASVSIAALALAMPAAATGLEFGGGLGLGGSADISGSAGFAGSSQFGGGKAKSEHQSYGQSESTFKTEWKAGQHGINASSEGRTLAGSGSLSQVTASSKGNGFASGAAGGVGFGAGGSAGLAGAIGN